MMNLLFQVKQRRANAILVEVCLEVDGLGEGLAEVLLQGGHQLVLALLVHLGQVVQLGDPVVDRLGHPAPEGFTKPLQDFAVLHFDAVADWPLRSSLWICCQVDEEVREHFTLFRRGFITKFYFLAELVLFTF